MSKFQVGDRVERIEDRPIRGAVVIEVYEPHVEGAETTYLIKYDEGGEGFWPESGLKMA
jgi:hypothetical protein